MNEYYISWMNLNIAMMDLYIEFARIFNLKSRVAIEYGYIPEDPKSYGKTYFDEKIIKINWTRCISSKILLIALYHEFRHIWQYENYPEVMAAWMHDMDFYNAHKDEYFCIPEQDAQAFGDSQGSKHLDSVWDYAMDYYHQAYEEIRPFSVLNADAFLKVETELLFDSSQALALSYWPTVEKLSEDFLSMVPRDVR